MGAEQSTPEGAPGPAPAATSSPAEAMAPDAAAAPMRMANGLGAISEDEQAPDESASNAVVVTTKQVELMDPEKVLQTLGVATVQSNHELAASCCGRVRALCREPSGRNECMNFGALRILNDTFEKMRANASVVVQALAAIVNIYADERFERSRAVDGGALSIVVEVIERFPTDKEMCYVACVAIRNLCYGEGEDARKRRERAAADGAIEAAAAVLKAHPPESEGAPATGGPSCADVHESALNAIRVCVDDMPAEYRDRAFKAGVPDDGALRPLTKDASGHPLSFRGSMGTHRGGKTSLKVPGGSKGGMGLPSFRGFGSSFRSKKADPNTMTTNDKLSA